MEASDARRYLLSLDRERARRTSQHRGPLPMKVIHRILDRYLHNDKYTIAACALVCRTWHEQIGDVREWLEGHHRPFQHEFPRDITILVLEHLLYDKTTLKNCALVSKAWEPCARYHLFHTVFLNPHTFQKLQQYYPSYVTPDGKFQVYAAFLDLLNGSPSIRTCIQKLYLGDTLSPWCQLQADRYMPLDLRMLHALLSHLQHLRVLHLRGVQIESAEAYELETIPAGALAISGHLSPRLCEIALHDVVYDQAEDNNPDNFKQFPQKPSAWSFHLALAVSPKAHTITRISTRWSDRDWNNREELNLLLTAVGPSLRHLRLIFPHYMRRWYTSGETEPSEEMVLAALPSLSPCTNLTSLTVEPSLMDMAWRCLRTCIVTLPESVSEVHIEIALDWHNAARRQFAQVRAGIERVDLVASQSKHLQHVALHLQKPAAGQTVLEEESRALICREFFPELERAGKITCIVEDSTARPSLD